MAGLVAVLVASLVLLGPESAPIGPASPGAKPALHARQLADLPLDFVQNRGQWPKRAKFVAKKGALAATFERAAIELYLGKARKAPLRLAFAGASRNATIVGEKRRRGAYNFFFGNDPARWRSSVPAYSSLLYRGLHEGVDVRVRENAELLEYDVLLAPRANLGKVVIDAAGASKLKVARDGALLVRTSAGTLRQAPPVAWEVLPDGEKRPVASRFRLLDGHRYGFAVPHRDPARPLVIDPGLEWATYVGGSGDETVKGLSLTSDGTGDIVLAGQTYSPDFQHTAGNLLPVGWTPYVARVNATGTALVYATFFGGSFNHAVLHVALDAADRPVVVGDTNSLDFPTTPGAYDRTPGNGMRGDYDAFVIKFDASGGGPAFGTYLAGSPDAGADQAWRAAHDASGSLIVSGFTTSADFPTTPGAYDRTLSSKDIFISRLDPTGSRLTYSTLLGGNAGEDVFDMVVDPQGFVTLTGQTFSTSFPWTADAFDPSYNDYGDGFVARLKLDGAGAADLKYATYFGGVQYVEAGDGIAFDPANPELVTVSGFTRSGDFPTTAGALLRTHFTPIDTSMGFVARFRFPAAGPGSLVWSTFYGAPGNQSADDVVVDSTGAAIIVGGTAANNPPTTERAYDRIPGGGGPTWNYAPGKADGLVARISSDGSRILYSTLIGGARSGDVAQHVAYAGGTSVVIAGLTTATDFPVTPGAFDAVYAADGKASDRSAPGTLAEDAFVAKLTLEAPAAGDTTAPPTPELRGPADAASFSSDARVTFDWTDVPDPSGIAAYHLQVSPNPTFTNDFDAELAGWFEPWTMTSVAIKGFSDSSSGTWYWRVQALDRANNLGPWSAVRTLTIAPRTPPPTPTLVSPPNNGRFAPGTIVFDWNAATGATSYELQVDTSSTFSNAGKTYATGLTQTRHSLSFAAERRYWWRVRGTNSSWTPGAWSTAWSFEIKKGAAPAPAPPPESSPAPGPGTALSELRLSQDTAFTTGTIQGTVVLNGAAPSGGAVVQLTSSDPDRVAVPATVTVPAGSSSASFDATATPSTHFMSVAVTGEYGGATEGAILSLYPAEPALQLDGFAVSTNTPLGGSTVEGTVSLIPGWTAGPSGAIVTLGSTNPALASVPSNVTIPPGANKTSFTITTHPVERPTDVTILASRSMTIPQALQLLPPAALTSLALNPETVIGGDSSEGTVTLSSPAPAGGVEVSLSSHDTTVATVPASVTVPAGASTATFPISTKVVCCQGHWSIISASAGGLTRTKTINVNPAPSGPTLSSLTLTPASVTGGDASTGKVTLTAPAPTGGRAVELKSSNTAVATVPSFVNVPGGQTSATFTVTTTSVTSSTALTISGWYFTQRQATLTVNPPGAAPTLSSLNLNPTSVAGGTSSTGTVTLTGAAPSGGSVVTLTSNAAAATVPASVTVAAGQTSATFTVTTTSVSSSTSATISATFDGVTQTATLSVTAPPSTADTVSVQLAEYSGGRLRVEASSSSSSATLKAHVTSTDVLIGTLQNEGGGRYRGEFSWPSSPGSITVKSSLGGSATKTVTVK